MADNRKYYYLKLKESYFDEDAIVLLESMQNGMLCSNILLKLYLKSLKKRGKAPACREYPRHRTDDNRNHSPASRHRGEGFAGKALPEAVAELLLPAFLPFNLLKAGLNAGFTFLLYKPVTTVLRKAGYISGSQNVQGRKPVGLWLLSEVIVITCILLILSLNGII